MSSKRPQDELARYISRREFLSAAGAGALTLALAGSLPAALAPKPAGKPNIVLIVGDDLGYAELGCQGSKDLKTPYIDSIAKNGVRFTNGYVSCPVCSPTRAGLMTGRYQQRFGHELNPGPPGEASTDFGMDLGEKTIADRLKGLGYRTGIFGKWHLGYEPQFHPQKRGFDEFFGFLAGAHPYSNSLAGTNNPILRSSKIVEKINYATDDFAREAVSFIQRNKDVPFFLYLPFNAVHGPLQDPPEKYLARYSSIQDKKRRTFAAMNAAMDDGVGRVLGKLRELKLEDNTLVFFVSDNGGPTFSTTSCNKPLRGYKGDVLEGGIRVPYMMQWKGHLPAGKLINDPVISLDIHPTILAAAGGQAPVQKKLDGVNLIPFISGKTKTAPHSRLFWRYGSKWAVRMGDWKLESDGTGAPELYNLSKDITESANIAEKNPDKVKYLQSAYDEWNSELIPPRWKMQRTNKKPSAKAKAKKALKNLGK